MTGAYPSAARGGGTPAALLLSLSRVLASGGKWDAVSERKSECTQQTGAQTTETVDAWARAMENLRVSTTGTGVRLCSSTGHAENQTEQCNLLLKVYTMLSTELSAASVR